MLHHPVIQMTTPFQLSFPVAAHRLPQRLPPPIRSCRRLASNNTTGSKGMSWFYEMELQVREYEIDGFQVVNNAVYNNYCEHCIFEMLDKIGFDDDTLALAISETSYKYLAPLKKKDKFLIKSRIYDYSASRLYFENFIFKRPNHEPVLEGKTTIVFLNKSGHPVRIPPSLKIDHFCLEENKRE